MYVYLVELEDCIKIGVSLNIDARLSTYKNKKRHLHFEIKGNYLETKAWFLELGMMEKFKSETEYIYGFSFEECLEYLQNLIKIMPDDTFYLRPLDIDVIYNIDGYIDLELISLYINKERILKNKPLARLDKYTKSKSTKLFSDEIERKYGKKAFMTKKGKYGGSFALPMVVLDYLCWSDVDIKIRVYAYMYLNVEYIDFINLGVQNVTN